MDEKTIKELIQRGRDFLKSQTTMEKEQTEGDYKTDQELKRPQPPLVKAPMTESRIDLPRNFESLKLEDSLLSLLLKRKSSRVYTQEDMSLLQLSFLLWATQGVKGIRGKSYATLRTVPCAQPAADAAADRLCTDMDKFRFHTGSLQRAGSLSQRSVGTALRMGAAV